MIIPKNMILINEDTFEEILQNIENLTQLTQDRITDHTIKKDEICKEDSWYLWNVLSQLKETAHTLAKAKNE